MSRLMDEQEAILEEVDDGKKQFWLSHQNIDLESMNEEDFRSSYDHVNTGPLFAPLRDYDDSL